MANNLSRRRARDHEQSSIAAGDGYSCYQYRLCGTPPERCRPSRVRRVLVIWDLRPRSQASSPSPWCGTSDQYHALDRPRGVAYTVRVFREEEVLHRYSGMGETTAAHGNEPLEQWQAM
jgi:hypothetical protein